jgi:5-methylcytosine-specific restriction endonuclease McrA
VYTDPPLPHTFTKILNALCPTIGESLTAYNLLPSHRAPQEFLLPVLTTFLSTLLTPPPPPSLARLSATECEICERSWVPLTYHHLIPREVHAKVLKRGWHREEQLQNVAWLCRACHTFVHHVASNEELAKEWFTVERLLERDDVVKFAGWVGKVRWKAK